MSIASGITPSQSQAHTLHPAEVMKGCALHNTRGDRCVRACARNYFAFVKSVCGNENVTWLRGLAGETASES
jgi:hypothetical protein